MGTKTTTNAGVVWGSHQSVATVCKNDGGNCRYDGCPGLDRNNKRRRSYPTRYQCLQCSIEKGYPVYLCNTTKKRADGTYFAVLCHMKSCCPVGWTQNFSCEILGGGRSFASTFWFICITRQLIQNSTEPDSVDDIYDQSPAIDV